MPPRIEFSCRGARSPALFTALLAIMLVETVVLHLWLATTHPVVAWSLTILSALSAAWLIGDYRALLQACVRVDREALHLVIGWRVQASIPRSQLASVSHASWRDIPDGARPGFADITKPAAPNIIIRCDPAAPVRLVRSITRPLNTIALCVDDPDGLVMLMRAPVDDVLDE
jgi:hypothetical protein